MLSGHRFSALRRRQVRPVSSAKKSPKRPFPSAEEVLAFIKDSPTAVTRREIARAFHITGDDRIRLKALMKELQSDGAVERGRGKKVAPPSSLPDVTVLEVSEIDSDGETLARPAGWKEETPPPRIYMAPEKRGHPALAPGDRVLARLRRETDGTYTARTVKRLGEPGTHEDARIVGIFRKRPGGGIVEPSDRRQKTSVYVPEDHIAGAEDGELVVAELAGGARLGPRRATIADRLGDPHDPRAISLIAIHGAGIPTDFPKAALAQADAATVPGLPGREDLRDLLLVTIDGADARDFDDAVWAQPDEDPANPGGWHLMVAIADVAHYVSPGSPLDREAFKRGNSCYFPDRVVPMLPEALSNGLCSLKPGEDRACIAAHLWIDAKGKLLRHRFVRGLMRSAARLTYEQVQDARNGVPDDATGPLVAPVIDPLYGAFRALQAAREHRGTLDLDMPERQVVIGPDGHVAGIVGRQRLDSHRLIEEFMIAANVAAAETLEGRGTPCLFRVHDTPDEARLEALREFLAPLGYRLAKGQAVRPRIFSQILVQASGRPEAPLINQMVLRSQAQAIYSPENLGHFGLALPRYAHFTSPIRRYADLTVHRGLIRQLRLGADPKADGAPDEELLRLEEIGHHISFTERRAAQAERDAVDRFVAAFLSDQIGAIFAGRVAGVTRFGLFVALDESGADGFVPIGSLPDDYYDHDATAHALVGRRWGRLFRLGARVRVEVMEADPLTASCIFRLLDAEDGADADWMPRPAAGRRERVPARGKPGRPGKGGGKPRR